MSNYLFIKGFFDTVDLFTDELITELKKLGENCIILKKDTLEKDVKGLFTLLKEEKIEKAIVFNNLGFKIGTDTGDNIWDRYDIPYIDILMDHPFHFHSMLTELPKTAKVYCVDRNHVEYIKKYYQNIKKVDFLPHGGCFNNITKIKDATRDIDILYAGNLSRTLVENLIPDFSSFKDIDGALFSEQALNELIQSPKKPTEKVITSILSAKGVLKTKEDALYYINGFRFLDGFAVSFFRELSIRILVENGFRVTVLGEGWAECPWINENLTLVGRVNAKEVLGYMKRAKIVLNTLTWFKDGSHDRVFNGQLSGAAVLTDRSKYFEEIYDDGKDIQFFSLNEMDKLIYKADKLLSEDEYREDIANLGLKKSKNNHTWANRLETILGE